MEEGLSFLENKNGEIEQQIDRLNQTHRIGAKTENKRRPIIVKFVSYLERRKVFNSNKRLKGKSFHYWELYGIMDA